MFQTKLIWPKYEKEISETGSTYQQTHKEK